MQPHRYPAAGTPGAAYHRAATFQPAARAQQAHVARAAQVPAHTRPATVQYAAPPGAVAAAHATTGRATYPGQPVGRHPRKITGEQTAPPATTYRMPHGSQDNVLQPALPVAHAAPYGAAFSGLPAGERRKAYSTENVKKEFKSAPDHHAKGTSGPYRKEPVPPMAMQGSNEVDKLKNLLLIMRSPKVLEQYAKTTFRRYDADGNGVLSLEELEVVIPELARDLGLHIPEDAEERKKQVRSRMRKFDANGDGILSEDEFLELYKWYLWRQYEDLMPPNFKRKSQIGSVKRGVPSQVYTIGKELGKGAFGIAYKVRHKTHPDIERVMKTVNKQKAIDSGTPLALIHQEIDLLAILDHPHILKLFEHYQDHTNIYIITGVCNGGELLDVVEDHANKGKALPESWIARVFGQVLEGISYAHAKGVMHKDLKFENVMLRYKVTAESPVEQIHAIIIDVGLAELFGQQHGKSQRSDQLAGSLSTMAPEVIGRDFSFKCDVWSLGIMLFAIYNAVPQYIPDGEGGQVLFTYPFFPSPTNEDPYGLTALVAAQRAGPPMSQIAHASAKAQDAILKMLTFNERDRPTAPEALAHPFFQETDPSISVELSPAQVQSLLKHREEKTWWNAMISAAASQIPATKVMHLSDVFRTIDTDCNGFIEKQELCGRLESLGVSKEAAVKAADAADYDNSGKIEWSEFVAAMLPASQELFATALQVAFSHFDTNHDGHLDRAEITTLLESGHISQDHMPGKTVEQMISELDTNHDGEISFEEFHHYFISQESQCVSLSS